MNSEKKKINCGLGYCSPIWQGNDMTKRECAHCGEKWHEETDLSWLHPSTQTIARIVMGAFALAACAVLLATIIRTWA